MCMKLLKNKILRLYYFFNCLHTLYKLVFWYSWLTSFVLPNQYDKMLLWVIAKFLQFTCETRSPLESEHINVIGRVYKTPRQCLRICILRLANFESLKLYLIDNTLRNIQGKDHACTDPLSGLLYRLVYFHHVGYIHLRWLFTIAIVNICGYSFTHSFVQFSLMSCIK